MKANLINLYGRFVGRFGVKAVIGVAAIPLLIFGALAFNLASAAIQASQYFNLMSRASTAIQAGNLGEAGKLLDEASEVNPDGSTEIALLEQEIVVKEKVAANIEASQKAFEIAADQIQQGQYLEAVSSLKGVHKDSGDLFDRAQSQIDEVSLLAIAEALPQAASLASKGMFQKALTQISNVKEVVGSNEQLTTASLKYEKGLAAQKKLARKAAFAKMWGKKDVFSNTTWFRDQSSPRFINRNAFYIYFGVAAGEAQSLRLKIQYLDDDWLFIDSAQVSVDGVVYDLDAPDWDRDNNTSIWEWSDEVLSDRGMVEAIIRSKKAIIRFDGDKYYDTRTISAGQKAALKNVLSAYDNF